MRAFLLGLVLAGTAAMPVSAQVTQTYNYDANGRLTGVSTSGAAGTNTAAYVYDDANNRTLRGQSGSGAYAMLLELPVNQALRPDQALVSADQRFSLAVRANGGLELWDGEAAITLAALSDIFDIGSDQHASFRPRLAADSVLSLTNTGDLVAFNDDRVVWSLGSLVEEGAR